MEYKEKSLLAYNTSLKKIKSFGFDINNINPDDLCEYMKLNNTPLKTQNLYISSLQWYNKNNKNDKELSEKLTKKTTELRMLINKEYDQNKLSEREKKNYIPWEIILSVYDELKKKFQNNSTNIRINEDYLLLSFYILHPPRRSDYQNMYIEDISLDDINPCHIITTNSEYSGEWFSLNRLQKDERINKTKNPGKNYYVNYNGTGYFIFNDYKTYSFYGKQIIEVKTELNNIIQNYIKFNNLKTSDKLLDLSHKNYIQRIQTIFKGYTNRQPSIDILRHSYINYIITNYNNTNESASFGQRKIISLMMSHSIATQLIYFKFYKDTEKIVINPDGYVCDKKYVLGRNETEKLEKDKSDNRVRYLKNKEKIAAENKRKRDIVKQYKIDHLNKKMGSFSCEI